MTNNQQQLIDAKITELRSFAGPYWSWHKTETLREYITREIRQTPDDYFDACEYVAKHYGFWL